MPHLIDGCVSMKIHFFIPALLLISVSVRADDFLEMRDGTILNGKITELDSSTVSIEIPGGSLIRRPRSEILQIRYGIPKPRRVPFYAAALPRKQHRHLVGLGTRTQYGMFGYAFQEKMWKGIYGTAAMGVSGFDDLNFSLGFDWMWRNYRRVRPFAGFKLSTVDGNKDYFTDSTWIKMDPGIFGIYEVGFQILIRPNFGIHLAGGYRKAIYRGEVTVMDIQPYDTIGALFQGYDLLPYAIFTGSGFMQEMGLFWEF